MLRFVNICKNFGSQTAVQDIQLEVAKGEFFSLLGPSGCGKTTLLRMLAGFETPTSGEIFLDGQRIDQLPPQKRPLNMVFQRYALFPHLTVFDNVAYGPRLRKDSAKEVALKVERALDLVNLQDFGSRLPETLSGGQAQRVALARAIVNEPKVLLLDEPLSALDQKMREHMQTELRSLQKRIGITFIFVTHDQNEAMTLSDRIAVMNAGRLEQVSTPEELYQKPASHFCAQFVGRMNTLYGTVAAQSQSDRSGEVRVTLKNGGEISGFAPKALQGAGVLSFVRPEKISLQTASAPTDNLTNNQLSGELTLSMFHGSHYELHVRVDEDTTMRVMARPDVNAPLPTLGTRVHLQFDPRETFLFEHP